MSYQAVQWAMDDAPMLRTEKGKPDTTARAVLIARAERADDHGRDSHASYADVIWRTGFDERTIQRAEARLEQAGLLVRDGTTRFGTVRWNVDMKQHRDPAERDEIEAEIERRRSGNAEREKARRDRIRSMRDEALEEERVDSASARVDSASARVDSASARVDSASTRVDGTPPEPPVNLPEPPGEPSKEPPPGGTLPPDPLRPEAPRPSAPRIESESSISSHPGQPPQPETATRDRAHEDTPSPRNCPTHGNAFSAGNRPDGRPRCPLCRVGAGIPQPDPDPDPDPPPGNGPCPHGATNPCDLCRWETDHATNPGKLPRPPQPRPSGLAAVAFARRNPPELCTCTQRLNEATEELWITTGEDCPYHGDSQPDDDAPPPPQLTVIRGGRVA